MTKHARENAEIKEEVMALCDYFESRDLCANCAINVLGTLLGDILHKHIDNEEKIVDFFADLAEYTIVEYNKEKNGVSTTH